MSTQHTPGPWQVDLFHEALAAALKDHKEACPENLMWAIADVCARFNPNFDRARFLAACGVQEG